MNKLILLMGIAIFMLSGCVTYHAERGAQALVNPTPFEGPTYRTEWSISEERVTAQGFSCIWFGLFVSAETKYTEAPGEHFTLSASERAIQYAKAAATYEACERTNADALLGISFRYKVTNYLIFTSVSCEATGFPASVTRLVIE